MTPREQARRIGQLRGRGNNMQQGLSAQMGIGQQAQQQMLANQRAQAQKAAQDEEAVRRTAEKEADRLQREEERRQEDLREEQRYAEEKLRKSQERDEERAHKRATQRDDIEYRRKKFEEDREFERQREEARYKEETRRSQGAANTKRQDDQAKFMLEQAQKEQERKRKEQAEQNDPEKKLKREQASEKQKRLDAARKRYEEAQKTPDDLDDVAAESDILKELDPDAWQRNENARNTEANRLRSENDPVKKYDREVSEENSRRFAESKKRLEAAKATPDPEDDIAAEEDILQHLNPAEYGRRQSAERKPKKENQAKRIDAAGDEVEKVNKELMDAQTRAKRAAMDEAIKRAGAGRSGRYKEEDVKKLYDELLPKYEAIEGVEQKKSELLRRSNRAYGNPDLGKPGPGGGAGPAEDILQSMGTDEQEDASPEETEDFFEDGQPDREPADVLSILSAEGGDDQPLRKWMQDAQAGKFANPLSTEEVVKAVLKRFPDADLGELVDPKSKAWESVPDETRKDMRENPDKYFNETGLQPDALAQFGPILAAKGGLGAAAGAVGAARTAGAALPIGQRFAVGALTSIPGSMAGGEVGRELAGKEGEMVGSAVGALPGAALGGFYGAMRPAAAGLSEAAATAGTEAAASVGLPPMVGALAGGAIPGGADAPKSGKKLTPYEDWLIHEPDLTPQEKAQLKTPEEYYRGADPIPDDVAPQSFKNAQELRESVAPVKHENVDPDVLASINAREGRTWYQIQDELDAIKKPGERLDQLEQTLKTSLEQKTIGQSFFDEVSAKIDQLKSEAGPVPKNVLDEMNDPDFEANLAKIGSKETLPKNDLDAEIMRLKNEFDQVLDEDPFSPKLEGIENKLKEKYKQRNERDGVNFRLADDLKGLSLSEESNLSYIPHDPKNFKGQVLEDATRDVQKILPGKGSVNLNMLGGQDIYEGVAKIGKAVHGFVTRGSDLEDKLAMRSAASLHGVDLPYENRVNAGAADLRDVEEVTPEIADIVRVPVADTHVRSQEVMKNVEPFFENIKPNSKVDQVLAYKPGDKAALLAAGGQEAVDAAYIMQHEYFKLWERLKNKALAHGTPEEIKFWKGRKAPSNYITFFRNNFNKIFGDGKYSQDVMSKYMTPPKQGSLQAGDSAVDAFEAYSGAAVRKLELGTAIDDAREAMKHYGNSVRGRGQKMFAEMYLNRLEGKAPLGQRALDWMSEVVSDWTKQDINVSKLAVGMRTASSLAILGLNQGVALTNAIFGGLAGVAGPNFRKAMSEFRKQGYKKTTDILQNLQLTHMEPRVRLGKRNISSWGDLLDTTQYHSMGQKLEKVMFSSMDFSNNITAGVAYWQGTINGRISGGKAGLTGKALDEFANAAGVRRALEVQNIGITVERAPMFSDPAFSLVSQFVRPAVKQADLVMRKMGGQALKGNGAPLLKYMAATGATILLGKEVFGVDLKEKLLGFLNPSEVGGMARIFDANESPVARLVAEVYNTVKHASQLEGKKAGKSALKVAATSIPGGVAMRRMIAAWLEDEKETHGITTNRSTADRLKKGLTGYKTNLDAARSSLNKAHSMPNETDEEADKRAAAIEDAEDVLLNFQD